MSSNSVPVFPINAISYVTDRSITNPGDVLSNSFPGHLQAFEGNVETVPVTKYGAGPAEVYRLRYDLGDGDDVQLYKFSIGPLEVSVSYDPKSTGIILQAFLSIPIIGTVSVGTVSGTLKKGVSVKIGFGDLLGGEVGARLTSGQASLHYNFNAFGKHLEGEVKIF